MVDVLLPTTDTQLPITKLAHQEPEEGPGTADSSDGLEECGDSLGIGDTLVSLLHCLTHGRLVTMVHTIVNVSSVMAMTVSMATTSHRLKTAGFKLV